MKKTIPETPFTEADHAAQLLKELLPFEKFSVSKSEDNVNTIIRENVVYPKYLPVDYSLEKQLGALEEQGAISWIPDSKNQLIITKFDAAKLARIVDTRHGFSTVESQLSGDADASLRKIATLIKEGVETHALIVDLVPEAHKLPQQKGKPVLNIRQDGGSSPENNPFDQLYHLLYKNPAWVADRDRDSLFNSQIFCGYIQIDNFLTLNKLQNEFNGLGFKVDGLKEQLASCKEKQPIQFEGPKASQTIKGIKIDEPSASYAGDEKTRKSRDAIREAGK